jgi:hypothetical protein
MSEIVFVPSLWGILLYWSLTSTGGLSTSFKSLKANLVLSSAVALTGIALPIGLSYVLKSLLNATSIQAFAAGAALCSTSLGTTFTVLASSGLSSSRLGVVLTSAAMMDDVVGLVMVQVITNLGDGDGNISAITIVRPILVSMAFAVTIPLGCRLIVKPLTISLNRHRVRRPDAWPTKILQYRQTAFILHTALLLGLVAGASYAGTSNLFAAYIAGASISWWDSEIPHPPRHLDAAGEASLQEKTGKAIPIWGTQSDSEQVASHAENDISAHQESNSEQPTGPGSGINLHDAHLRANSQIAAVDTDGIYTAPQRVPESATKSVWSGCGVNEETSGPAIYERYYQQAVGRVLQPLFFASIGFSIPITRMFQSSIVWRGIVYTVLMSFGKVTCGLWLVRLSLAPTNALRTIVRKLKVPSVPHVWGESHSGGNSSTRPVLDRIQPEQQNVPQESTQSISDPQTSTASKPFSIHPPLILACAMTARGEIGFLISAVAESTGVFSSAERSQDAESDIFLVVTWAIVLCTILGPLGVGLVVRRVKTLEERKNRAQQGAGRDVLGVWGVG